MLLFSSIEFLSNEDLSSNVSCNAVLNIPENSANDTITEWWGLFQNSSHVFDRSTDAPTALELIIYSERIATPLFSSVAALG